MSEKLIYKVVFIYQEQVYEIYAENVYQGDMYGFIIVEDLVFGEKSSIVLDPTEEKLRKEFEGVKRSFIPLHEVLRIDQVQKRGVAKIVSISGHATADAVSISGLYRPDKK